MDQVFRRPIGEVDAPLLEREGESSGLGRDLARIDYEIRLEVMNALQWDLAVPRHQVTATVDGG
jgi:hypothetical protein